MVHPKAHRIYRYALSPKPIIVSTLQYQRRIILFAIIHYRSRFTWHTYSGYYINTLNHKLLYGMLRRVITVGVAMNSITHRRIVT